MLPTLPWIPLLFATVMGMGARRADLRNEEGAYHLFFATRPIDSDLMLRAKYAAITRGVALSWAMTLGVGFLWLCTSASDQVVDGPLWRFLLSYSRPSDLLLGAVILCGLVAWTWRNQVVGAFVDFVPSRVVARVYPVAIVLLGLTYFILFVNIRPLRIETDTRLLLSLALGVLLAEKLWVAWSVAHRLVRLRPEEAEYVRRVQVMWPRYAAVASATLLWIVTTMTRDMPSVPGMLSAPVAILAGALLTPLARPLGARLALEQGRHRA
jgi:hypothetical protein